MEQKCAVVDANHVFRAPGPTWGILARFPGALRPHQRLKLTRLGLELCVLPANATLDMRRRQVSNRLSSSQNMTAFSCTVQPAAEVPRRPLAFLLIHIWK